MVKYMYYLRPGTRMLQNRYNLETGTYRLYNTQVNEYAEISSYAAKLIRKAHKNGTFELIFREGEKSSFLNELIEMGLIITDISPNDNDKIYLGNHLWHKFPLTALNIELTNTCNLRCKHCYGSFSESQKPKFVPFEWIQRSLYSFNALHVKTIALTGGETTMHPYFLEITDFFFEKWV